MQWVEREPSLGSGVGEGPGARKELDGRTYPWGPTLGRGPDSEALCKDGREIRWRRHRRVAGYPTAQGPYGRLDMEGNVALGCGRLYDSGLLHGYLKHTAIRRERPKKKGAEKEEICVLRGGRCWFTSTPISTPVRCGFQPYRNRVFSTEGFRYRPGGGSTSHGIINNGPSIQIGSVFGWPWSVEGMLGMNTAFRGRLRYSRE